MTDDITRVPQDVMYAAINALEMDPARPYFATDVTLAELNKKGTVAYASRLKSATRRAIQAVAPGRDFNTALRIVMGGAVDIRKGTIKTVEDLMLPGLGGPPVGVPVSGSEKRRADTAALYAAQKVLKDPGVQMSKGAQPVNGKISMAFEEGTLDALKQVDPDPNTAIAKSLAVYDAVQGKRQGSSLRQIGMDEEIDIEALTRANGGRPPEFVAVPKNEMATVNWRENEGGFLRMLTPMVQRDYERESGQTMPPGVESVPIEQLRTTPRNMRARLPAFDEKALKVSLPTLLAQSEPELAPLIRRAKMFSFDKTSEQLVSDMMERDWREWLGQAITPFPTTFIESGIRWLTWQAEDDAEPVTAVGSIGVLIHGRVIVPCYRASQLAGSSPHRIISTKPHEADMNVYEFYTPEELALTAGCRRDFPDLIKVWGAEYVAKYGHIDGTTYPGGELLISGHEPSARRLMLLTDRYSDMGMYVMAVTDGILRWALAALAVINMQRDVIEVESKTTNHDGRTWVGNKHVPKYTPSLIRLKPEAPRVEYVEPVTGARAEPDPDREIIRKREHDVRAHFVTKDYKPNDDWEEYQTHDGRTRYRRIRKAHKRGDAELGRVDSHYALGDAHPERLTDEKPTRGETELADALSRDMGDSNEHTALHDEGSPDQAPDQTTASPGESSAPSDASNRGGLRLWARNAAEYIKQIFKR